MTKAELLAAARFCFADAHDMQGAKHPDEMEEMRSDVRDIEHFVLKVIRGTPESRLRTLGINRLDLNFTYKDKDKGDG